MRSYRAFLSGIFALCMIFIPKAHAQGKMVWDNYDGMIKTSSSIGALGNNLFGDSVDLYTGRVEFRVKDIDLPGSNGLMVAFGRKLEVESQLTNGVMGDWELDVPYMHGTFVTDYWQSSVPDAPNQRCSIDPSNYMTGTPPVVIGTHLFGFSSAEYWSGNSVYIPSSGDKQMLVLTQENQNHPTSGDSYYWTTSDNWMFSCLSSSANGVPGEGFIAISPDGIKYTFNWFYKRNYDPVIEKLKKPYIQCTIQSDDCNTIVTRREIRIAATKVEDRFGNYVDYIYDENHPDRLNSIVASDGRRIDLAYDANGKVRTVSTSGRTWRYTFGNNGKLASVMLPDGSSWNISPWNFTRYLNLQSLHGDCTGPSGSPSGAVLGAITITHPSGAIGAFTFGIVRHARSYVPRMCVNVPFGGTYSGYALVIDSISLLKKEISGSGINHPESWNYAYSAGNLSPENWSFDDQCSNSACSPIKTTTISNTDGVWTRYTIHNRYGLLEGKTKLIEVGAGNTIYQKTENFYVEDPAGQAYPEIVGRNPCYRCERSNETPTPLLRRVITQDGRQFSRSATSFDKYARPTTIVKSSAASP